LQRWGCLQVRMRGLQHLLGKKSNGRIRQRFFKGIEANAGMGLTNTSLTRRQVVWVALITLLVAFCAGIIELSLALKRERAAAMRSAGEITQVVSGSASHALWSLDQSLGESVASSVMTFGQVYRVRIFDELGRPFIDRTRTRSPQIPAAARLIAEPFAALFGDLAVRRIPLQGPELERGLDVGELVIDLDTNVLARAFLAQVRDRLLSLLALTITLAALLAWITRRTLICHLVHLAEQVAAIDPDDPAATRLELPAQHRDNELGQLVHTLQSTLTQLAETQGELRHLATRDPLTGLPNRTLLTEHLAQRIHAAGAEEQPLGIGCCAPLPATLNRPSPASRPWSPAPVAMSLCCCTTLKARSTAPADWPSVCSRPCIDRSRSRAIPCIRAPRSALRCSRTTAATRKP